MSKVIPFDVIQTPIINNNNNNNYYYGLQWLKCVIDMQQL